MTELAKVELECEHCHVGLARHARLTVEMKPGKDGSPWFLCLRCWLDGVRPMDYKEPKAAVAISVASAPAREPAPRQKKKKAS